MYRAYTTVILQTRTHARTHARTQTHISIVLVSSTIVLLLYTQISEYSRPTTCIMCEFESIRWRISRMLGSEVVYPEFFPACGSSQNEMNFFML